MINFGIIMNRQIDLSAARLRTMLPVAALVVCVLLAPESGRAQSVVMATLTGSNGSSAITITSNQTFTLTLSITTNFPSVGIAYFLASNAAGSGLFRITGINATGSPYPPGPLVCSGPGDPCLLDPVNNNGLGAAAGHGATVQPGTYTIATFTFSTMNAPVGQYTISTDRGVIFDTPGGVEGRPFTAVATINVVPEPTTVGLGVVGGAMLLLAARRRQRTGT